MDDPAAHERHQRAADGVPLGERRRGLDHSAPELTTRDSTALETLRVQRAEARPAGYAGAVDRRWHRAERSHRTGLEELLEEERVPLGELDRGGAFDGVELSRAGQRRGERAGVDRRRAGRERSSPRATRVATRAARAARDRGGAAGPWSSRRGTRRGRATCRPPSGRRRRRSGRPAIARERLEETAKRPEPFALRPSAPARASVAITRSASASSASAASSGPPAAEDLNSGSSAGPSP